MSMVRAIMIGGVAFAVVSWAAMTAGRDHAEPSASTSEPPGGTLVMEPIELARVVMWVPSHRTGPFVNHSCQNLPYSCSYVLSPEVKHSKTPSCPVETARLLAEYVAGYYGKNLPLALFDGWRWESPVDLCQYETVLYQLPRHGGSWENAVEAVVDLSSGTLAYQWLGTPPESDAQTAENPRGSQVEALSFSQMRTRNGYPKTPIYW